MKLDKVDYTLDKGVAILTMNSPGNLNAIDVNMAQQLLERLNQCNRNPEVKVIFLTGGTKAFSAGGDIQYLYNSIKQDLPESSELVVLVGDLALTMKRLDKLVVTCVSGPAAGAGANLALSGDFVFCSEKAQFIQAFVGIALVPDTGGPYLLSRSIGVQRALEICISGRPVHAEEAYHLGLIYQICPAEELLVTALDFAHKLTKGPLLAYTNIKKQIYGAAFHDYERYLHEVEENTMMACAGTHDYREGVCAFVEKRPPKFIGG